MINADDLPDIKSVKIPFRICLFGRTIGEKAGLDVVGIPFAADDHRVRLRDAGRLKIEAGFKPRFGKFIDVAAGIPPTEGQRLAVAVGEKAERKIRAIFHEPIGVPGRTDIAGGNRFIPQHPESTQLAVMVLQEAVSPAVISIQSLPTR